MPPLPPSVWIVPLREIGERPLADDLGGAVAARGGQDDGPGAGRAVGDRHRRAVGPVGLKCNRLGRADRAAQDVAVAEKREVSRPR